MSERFAGHFPDYDVLEKWDGPDWDEQTRRVIRNRIEHVPPFRFFDADEVTLLEAIVERILPQPDRVDRRARVPIAPWIDEKLYHDSRDGYRYQDMPPQRDAWRLGLRGIAEEALTSHGKAYATLAGEDQDAVLRRVQEGRVNAAPWARVSPPRFFRDVLCSSVARIYYAHPAAWSECGYSGPSSPRGHVRKWIGGVDPWEAHERDSPWGTA